MDPAARDAIHPAVQTRLDGLPPVTKFVHAHSAVLTTRQKAASFLRGPEGRDATLRLLQYTLRLSLYVQKRALPKSLLVRLVAVVSSLAALRRILALQSFVATLSDLPQLALHRTGSLDNRVDKVDAKVPPVHPGPPLTQVLHLVQSTLELLAVLTDNIYLFSRLGLLPLSRRATARADKLSDYAALGAAVVGLVQLQRERRALYAAGRRARRKAVETEKKLEELEFWEDTAARPVDKERVEEQKRLRERVKAERKRLRVLRGEVGAARWERLRLVAEGIFAVYDALDLERSAEFVKSWAGIVSSVIEFGQAWVQHSGSLRST